MEILDKVYEGATYTYDHDEPEGRRGFLYLVERVDVPSYPDYSRKVLVEVLTGPDAGIKFVTTPLNFVQRYKLHSMPEVKSEE